jgi:hypothetical protein
MENKRILSAEKIIDAFKRKNIFKELLPIRCTSGVFQLVHSIVYLIDINFETKACAFRISHRNQKGDDIYVYTCQDMIKETAVMEGKELVPMDEKTIRKNIRVKEGKNQRRIILKDKEPIHTATRVKHTKRIVLSILHQ